ncbi:MAG: hypothetical protein DRO99_02810 [Candidatus Aenigmatarchaeota archaeon]|nr:MAG: hypothetical protein DRO99_02810 [Candidatus Aenigmarchaeota archaeon]
MLKKKDKRLLYEFCLNSRLPYSILGRKSGMSQQLAAYKMKSFISNGMVGHSYPIIDYSYFSLLQFRVHFRVSYRSKEAFRGLVSRLYEHENVVGIMERSGRYDIIVTFMAKNPSSFNKTLKQLIAENPGLRNYMILTTVVSHYLPKKYLAMPDEDKDIIIGGDRESIEITDTEKDVLLSVCRDARAHIVKIARDADVSPRTAVSTMKRLSTKGVLKGFSSVLNLRKLGYHRSAMLIRYHNLSVDIEDKLRTFCIRNKNITEMHKLFGDFDVEITAEAETAEEIRKVFIQIRELFEEIIMDSDTFSVFRIHKRSFVPGEFFA